MMAKARRLADNVSQRVDIRPVIVEVKLGATGGKDIAEICFTFD
jgi:hypothetical protein